MADENKEEQGQEQPKEQEQSKSSGEEKTAGFGLYTWLIMATVVAAGITGGFALAQLVASTGGSAATASETQEGTISEDDPLSAMISTSAQEDNFWYFPLETVVANLDEPGVTRHVRVTVTLEVSSMLDETMGTEFLQKKQVVLTDYLTTYLAGLTLEGARGSRSRNRMKNEIKDNFNILLFPDSKPLINNVLTSDFAVD